MYMSMASSRVYNSATSTVYDSFVSFPSWTARNEHRLELDLCTLALSWNSNCVSLFALLALELCIFSFSTVIRTVYPCSLRWSLNCLSLLSQLEMELCILVRSGCDPKLLILVPPALWATGV